jgi:hypothetical protein
VSGELPAGIPPVKSGELKLEVVSGNGWLPQEIEARLPGR